MAGPKTEVTKPASTAVGEVVDYGDFTGGGFENQTRDDISIPFIGVLQAMSPQIEKMETAKAGMLINTVTEELFKGDVGLLFVPAVTQHVYVEWVPKSKGGGFVGVHDINSEVVKNALAASAEYGKAKVGDNELVETFYVYGVLCDEQQPTGMAVIAFTSTKIKVYKKYNTRVRTHLVSLPDGRRVTPPLFANLMRIKSVKESNPKGDFYNFELSAAVGNDLKSSLLPPTDARFKAAVECKQVVESGAARAAFESQTAGGEEGAAGPVPF